MRKLILPLLAAAFGVASPAHAANPRWATGWPYFQNNNGVPIVWYTTQPLYFTDPGDLSPTVNHATADALVASAAAAWNNSMSSLVLASGGALNEHLSSANVYLGSSGPVFPSDVQATNYLAKPIAVIYDTDGSVTDTLLGGGASNPGNCRQSAVTESVDSITTGGQIQHALIVLNGRCVTAAVATQQEMKYRLVRAFGRVLGLGWSQLNDNVFTGTPQATSQQAQNWPLMHPIDVLCGPYAYQCMLNPFTPRTDDLASLISLYPVTTAGNGKTLSYANATRAVGWTNFANQQGMEGVLVSLRRFHFGPGYSDTYDLTSAISGQSFQQTGGNAITPKGSAMSSSFGAANTYFEGYYAMNWVPVPSTDYFDNFTVTTSPINPLYTGQYAVGPYPVSQVAPSGPAMTGTAYVVNEYFGARIDLTADGGANLPGNTAPSAPVACSSFADGTENVPLAVPSTGFWSDTLCGYGHTAWSSLPVRANRTVTLEVTALDEQGYATTAKMLPVLGVWDSTDPAGSLPTVASQAVGLNASTLGMTNLIAATHTTRTLRLAIADQRGDGRPDYAYNARLLYADTVSPTSLPANGGVVTIAGMGFRPGNTVTVNGLPAYVTAWTSSSISLVAPPITGPLAADVVVSDLATGAQTRMAGALTYSQTTQPDLLNVVSKPADGGYVNSAGSPAFKIQVMLPDGVTPAPGVSVVFSSSKATFAACSGAVSCILTSDPMGFVASPVTPTNSGTVNVTATVGASSISTSFVALALPVDTLTVQSLPSGTVYATLPAATPFRLQVTLPDGTTPAAGAAVLITASNATLAACSAAASCTLIADASGKISTDITPLASGVVSLLASAGGGMISASFGVTALPADVLHLIRRPADGSYVGRSAVVPFAVQVMLGDDVTPASGASVTVSASAAMLACGLATCTLPADATGYVSTSVIPSAAGTVTLSTSAGGGALNTSFTAIAVPPDLLTLVSTPANGSYVGRTASSPFAVRVALGDTGAPAAGASVTVSATNATMACGVSPCTLTADVAGNVSTAVVPSSPGAVSLSATAGGGTISATLIASAIPPDTLHVVTQPASGSYASQAATIPFSVQAALGDTGAPAGGVSITLTATNATLGCGASTCILIANPSGIVSTSVTPSTAGNVILTASAGGGTTTTTFTAANLPPDVLHVLTAPTDNTFTGSPATLAFAVSVFLGDGVTPAANTSVIVTASNATLGACGLSTCTINSSALGMISTAVTAVAPGSVTLTATAGGGSVTAFFIAVSVPFAVQVVSAPSDSSYLHQVATTPFAVRVLLGSAVNPQRYGIHALSAQVGISQPAVGQPVNLTAVGASLGACGLPSCILMTDATGIVSTTVTPILSGPVTLFATSGGGTANFTFTANAAPDILHVTATPANGSYVNRTASPAFAVQALQGDGSTPDAGIQVTLTATGATLNVCGLATCVVNADSSGAVSSLVTATGLGSVTLSAAASGGTATTTFTTAPIPPDGLHIVSQPANGSYSGRPAAIPFTVQVALGETGAHAAGAAVTLVATNATLACGASSCTFTADSTGTVSSIVIPTAPGIVSLAAASGGSNVSTSFTAATIPPDSLHVTSQPSDGSYATRPTTLPLKVQTMFGDTGAPATGAVVTITAVNAILAACGATTCTLTADAEGNVLTGVTPIAPSIVTLTATSGGGSITATFSAAAVPPDILHILSQPASGSYATRSAATPLRVQALLGDTGATAVGALITLSAVDAILSACGLSICVLPADANGTVSTSVTPLAPGTVQLTASAGGGSSAASFTAVAIPPDALQVISQPADGAYVSVPAATSFTVAILLGDTGAPAIGVPVMVTATNATLAACGRSACTLTADASGTISTAVIPITTGPIDITASAGGGTITIVFNAAPPPPDVLRILAQPAASVYTGLPAATPLTVQVFLPDATTPAAGASVLLSAANAQLAACAGGTSCVVTANASGTVSTAVTPQAPGPVFVHASSAGGSASVTFSALALPADILTVVTAPSGLIDAGVPAATRFAVHVLLGDRITPAAGAAVTLTATGAIFAACPAVTCVLTADGLGNISTIITPVGAGTVILNAAAGGGTVSTTFNVAADILHVQALPANGSYTGSAASQPFALHVLLGDGITPAAGASVVVTAVNATLGTCGTPLCTFVADSQGNISTPVTPTASGPVILNAASTGGTISASFTAADHIRTLTIAQPTEYVAPNSTVAWAPAVNVLEDGIPAEGILVTWTSTSQGLTFSAGTSTSSSSGIASLPLTISPLGVNGFASGQVCAWTTICASFTAQAIDPSLWRLTALSGDTQTVSPTESFQPVILRAIDASGDAIAGVPIEIHQTIRALVTCPPSGRCPSGPVLTTANSMVVSDATGQAIVEPAQLPNASESTGIVAAAGVNGYIAVSLIKIP